jgi:hypothetical protein
MLKHFKIEKFTFIFSLILIGVISRWVPHWPNVTAIIGVSIVSAFYMNKGFQVFIPLAAMMLSDLLLGSHPTMMWVYAGIASASAYATFLGKRGYVGTGLTSVVCSLLFFMISNLGVWVSGGLYPLTEAGLVQAYLMAVPFLLNQILGDLFWTGSLLFLAEKVLSVSKQEALSAVK